MDTETDDAQLSLKTSPDKLEVMASVVPAKSSGKPLLAEQIVQALNDLGVPPARHRTIKINHLVASDEPMSAIVARGLRPVNGNAARFKSIFHTDNSHKPEAAEFNKINYFETKHYSAVEIDAPLMRRIPATEGFPGVNVLGQAIKSKPGKNLQFKRYKGSCVAPTDPDLLIAEIAGHPLPELQGVKVDNTLVVLKADLASGNIKFDGSVTVSGDVEPQVEIHATGDIFVKGTVENARLTAGHNIVIGGGVISETPPDTLAPPKITTHLQAGVDIHAMFLNQVEARAGNNISIQRYTLNCELHAGQQVLVGERGGKGAILGGRTTAALDITANIVGSTAYISSWLEVGDLVGLRASLAKPQQELDRRRHEAQQLADILAKLPPRKEQDKLGKLELNRADKIKAALVALEHRQSLLEAQCEQLAVTISAAQKAQIVVHKTLFPNTHVKINGAKHRQTTERRQTRFSGGSNGIIIE
jgi:uncharacterized protein (DUF342 family)